MNEITQEYIVRLTARPCQLPNAKELEHRIKSTFSKHMGVVVQRKDI